jgi:hypothetical protein
MDGWLAWLGLTVVALLATAIAVAWWEHRAGRAQVSPTDTPPPRAVNIDVPLDSTLAAGDLAQRRATLDGALDRMAQSASARAAGDSKWPETQPMIGAQLTPIRQPPQTSAH